eukprot:CAMPEP_0198576338 /NCGR_PEP_ID=MMETSP1462-20131121/117437_1 /TAXON_ID=1333877 /ORGANISM="Brandtodinium nutriculum, Strain RCC3387" /LENGTH=71 /DNA_ID=CAMNT_0044307597 /DNA_START=1 /DNA_END=216 /DNA_ORIENTATION=-
MKRAGAPTKSSQQHAHDLYNPLATRFEEDNAARFGTTCGIAIAWRRHSALRLPAGRPAQLHAWAAAAARSE